MDPSQQAEAIATQLQAAPRTARELGAALRKQGFEVGKKEVNALLYAAPHRFRHAVDFAESARWELAPGACPRPEFRAAFDAPRLSCRDHAGGGLAHFVTAPLPQGRSDLQLQKEGEGRYPTLRAICGVPTASGDLPKVSRIDDLTDLEALEALVDKGAALLLLTDSATAAGGGDLAAMLLCLLFKRAGNPILLTSPDA